MQTNKTYNIFQHTPAKPRLKSCNPYISQKVKTYFLSFPPFDIPLDLPLDLLDKTDEDTSST